MTFALDLPTAVRTESRKEVRSDVIHGWIVLATGPFFSISFIPVWKVTVVPVSEVLVHRWRRVPRVIEYVRVKTGLFIGVHISEVVCY